MRPRTHADLLAPDRVARLAGMVNPNTTPKYLRQFTRENYVSDALKMLHETMNGTQKFDVATLGGQIVQVAASPSVRVKAAVALVEAGLGKEGFETGDGAIPGVIALPELQLHPGDEIPAQYETADGMVLDVVEEEIEGAEREGAHDVAPPPIAEVETVNPAVVREVLARRNRAERNGHG